MADRPVLARPPVQVAGLVGSLDEIWRAICLLADTVVELPWTVVGGQMVFLHGLEHGRTPPRVSSDIDAAVDVRAERGAVRRLTAALHELGYELDGVSNDGHAHRFSKQAGSATAHVDVAVAGDAGPDGEGPAGVVVDLLVPEGLGARTDTTTVDGAEAFPAPGTSQALARTELVPVTVDGATVSLVPRPSLLGAIVAKAVACAVDRRDRERHHIDLVFLCGLVADPFALAEGTTRKDRQRLRRAAELVDATSPLWASNLSARPALEIIAGL